MFHFLIYCTHRRPKILKRWLTGATRLCSGYYIDKVDKRRKIPSICNAEVDALTNMRNRHHIFQYTPKKR